MCLLAKHYMMCGLACAVTWAMAASLTDVLINHQSINQSSINQSDQYLSDMCQIYVSDVFIPGTMLAHAFKLSVSPPLCVMPAGQYYTCMIQLHLKQLASLQTLCHCTATRQPAAIKLTPHHSGNHSSFLLSCQQHAALTVPLC